MHIHFDCSTALNARIFRNNHWQLPLYLLIWSSLCIVTTGSFQNIGGKGLKPCLSTIQIPGRQTAQVNQLIHDQECWFRSLTLIEQYTPSKPILGCVDAFSEAMTLLSDPQQGIISSVDEIGAVGHRIAHGGDISKAHVIDGSVSPFSVLPIPLFALISSHSVRPQNVSPVFRSWTASARQCSGPRSTIQQTSRVRPAIAPSLAAARLQSSR